MVFQVSCGSSNEQSITGGTEMKTGPITYVALGDSTGAGIGAVDGGYVARLYQRLLEQRPESQLFNLCLSGATTNEVVRGQLNQAVAKDPDLVTVGIGINDISHGLTIDQFAENYERILSTLKEKTHAQIIVTNIPNISTAPVVAPSMRDRYHQLMVSFNERLQEIADRHGVTVFDIYSITSRELPSHPEYFSRDGFHPSDKGYELWAVEMWPTIERVIGAGS
jgi:lysophospholipase L1-like esterase